VVLAVHASAVVDNFAPIARPATDAYRADVAAAPERGGDAAAVWLTVASLVEHAALVPEGEAADVLGTAIGLALEQLGEEAFVRLGAAEWGEADRVPSDAIVLLTDAMQSADLLNLAASTLDSLLGADRALGPVQRGRILAKRARVAWKLGMLEEADADIAASSTSDGANRAPSSKRARRSASWRSRSFAATIRMCAATRGAPCVWRSRAVCVR